VRGAGQALDRLHDRAREEERQRDEHAADDQDESITFWTGG
jgi:hypothetical protein